MSAINFFLERGHTPINKSVIFQGNDTVSVWVPATGKRVVVTNVSVAANLGTTVAFYFDTTTAYRAGIISTDGSTMTNPDIGCWESTVVTGRIFARKNTTLGECIVNLTGFEID